MPVLLRTKVVEGSNSHEPDFDDFWAKTEETEYNRQQFTSVNQVPPKLNGLWCLFWNSDEENGPANSRLIGAYGDLFMPKMDALSSKMNAREIYDHVPEDWEQSKTFAKVLNTFEHYTLDAFDDEEADIRVEGDGSRTGP